MVNMCLDVEGQDQLMNEISFPSLLTNSLSSKSNEVVECALSVIVIVLNKRGLLLI